MRLGLLLMLLICMTPTLAIQLTPATSDLYQPERHEITLRIFNTQNLTTPVLLSTDDPEGFITLSHEQVQLKAGVRETRFTAIVSTSPTTLPGRYTPVIIVEPLSESSRGQVTAVPGLRHRVDIIVPAEGAFLDANIQTSTGIANDPVSISVIARNVGTLPLEALHVELTITDPQGSTLSERSFTPRAVAPNERTRFDLEWVPPTSGEYTARAVLRYAGKQQELIETISVGDLYVDIGELGFGSYVPGEILRLDIPVTSAWNQPLRNVYATVDITQEESMISSLITPQTTLNSFATETLSAFWDTARISYGTYNVYVTVHYETKTSTKMYTIILDESGVRLHESFPTISLLLILLLIIMLCTAGYYIYLRTHR